MISSRFSLRQRISFRVDFYVRQQANSMSKTLIPSLGEGCIFLPFLKEVRRDYIVYQMVIPHLMWNPVVLNTSGFLPPQE